jgi:hypothetical protein
LNVAGGAFSALRYCRPRNRPILGEPDAIAEQVKQVSGGAGQLLIRADGGRLLTAVAWLPMRRDLARRRAWQSDPTGGSYIHHAAFFRAI